MQIFQDGSYTFDMIAFFLGAMAGFLSGLLGVGGGFLITPGLNLMGLPMPMAVGTSLAQMVGASFSGCVRHGLNRNIRYDLSLLLGAPLLIGVYLGRDLMVYLAGAGLSEDVPRGLFIVVLFCMGFTMLFKGSTIKNPSKTSSPKSPVFLLKGVLLFLITLTIGLLSGLLGMGGGFFMVPILTYIFCVRQAVASGSSLFAVFFGSLVGALAYAKASLVDVRLCFVLMAGSVAGAYLGAMLADRVDGARLKKLFSVLVLVAAFSMLLRQFGVKEEAFYLLFSSAFLLSVFSIGSVYAARRAL